MKNPHNDIDPASFRDPSGFIFSKNQTVYRAIAPRYFEDFSLFQTSTLYDLLVSKKMLLSHSAIIDTGILPKGYDTYKTIQPEKIPFISYPYEWSFSQLKSAALLTLSIQLQALKHGMTLKDATAYNVQFRGTAPVFIDTLSFEKYIEGKPWIAYRQFCEHFLAPLALMSYRTPVLSKITQTFLDGIPLALASSLLPKKSYLNSALLSHLHIHAKFQSTNTGPSASASSSKNAHISKEKLITLIKHLEEGIQSLQLKVSKSTWINYLEIDNYTDVSKSRKKEIISNWAQKIQPRIVWDLGCNTGEFSIIASKYAEQVVAMDGDILCIDSLHRHSKMKESQKILPLFVDLSNPTPALGWAGRERKTLPDRGKPDLILALALIHHLRISNNTPFEMIAKLFSEWSESAIVEFIPKDDSQIKKMLASREDIFDDLNQVDFEKIFGTYFEITDTSALPESGRILYLLKRRNA